MATIALLTMVIAVFIGVLALPRLFRSGKFGGWPRALIAVVLAVFLLFIAWLIVMVLVVGPFMQER
jgi:hypothetical protein